VVNETPNGRPIEEPTINLPVGMIHLLFKRMAASIHEHGNLRDGATARICNSAFPESRRRELCQICFGVSRINGQMVRDWASEMKKKRRGQ
jgi:hypothetical protein